MRAQLVILAVIAVILGGAFALVIRAESTPPGTSYVIPHYLRRPID